MDLDPDSDPDHFSALLFLFFSLIFIQKLDEPIRNEKIFIISLFFSKVQIWVLGVNKFFSVFG